MPVSTTTPGRLCARDIAHIRIAFRHRNDVGAREEGAFAPAVASSNTMISGRWRRARANANRCFSPPDKI
jgi:hypothetical protein